MDDARRVGGVEGFGDVDGQQRGLGALIGPWLIRSRRVIPSTYSMTR